MLDHLFRALVTSKNAAADDVLVDAMRVGTPAEQTVVLGALLARKSTRGLAGVLGLYESLPDRVRAEIVANVGAFHAAIREAGRSSEATGTRAAQRRGAIAVVADGRQGRLAYVLGESLRGGDEGHARAAAAALVALARWIARATDALQTDGRSLLADVEAPLVAAAESAATPAGDRVAPTIDFADPVALYRQLLANRPDVESAIVRALELHHGAVGQELLDAAMLLGDHAQSLTLAAAQAHARGGALRRLRQRPIADAEQVPAFLIGSARGPLRAGFAPALAAIDSPAALAAIARRAHWLGDALLAGCANTATAGAWLAEETLAADLARREVRELPAVARWIAASGLDDRQQDARLIQVMAACPTEATAGVSAAEASAARVAIVRVALARPRAQPGTVTNAGPASYEFLKRCLRDADEHVVRLAARDLIRRRPAELENTLLPAMATAPADVRRAIGRAVSGPGFETYWSRFDDMEPATRVTAGRAIMRLLPDAQARLGKRLSSPDVEDRLKALEIAAELELIEPLKGQVLPLCVDASARVRSKAVTVLGQLGSAAIDALLERVIHDGDARVRANAVEAMEQRPAGTRFVPLLTERARAGANRERANAIKALHQMKVEVAASQLLHMLRDPRSEHRISGLWALRRIGWWRMLTEVARLAREDDNLRVRQYAMGVLQAAVVESKRPPMQRAG